MNVTPAAVTQYLKGRRGRKLRESPTLEPVISALAEKVSQRIRAGTRGLEMVELVEAAYQIMAAGAGERILRRPGWEPRRNQWLDILKQRLELELRAAQRCLELANHIRDDYSRLLLRMIASDSIRHADVVSQIISWLETGHMPPFEPPGSEFLSAMLDIEDRAQELSLRRRIKIPHPVAKLLLESIDLDEEKHEKVIGRMLRLLHKRVGGQATHRKA
jgi:bacterioferritin (cytochrome b1)